MIALSERPEETAAAIAAAGGRAFIVRSEPKGAMMLP
jgi:hypothetical protein